MGLRKRVRALLRPPEDPRVELALRLPDGRVERLRAGPGERVWELARTLPLYLGPACPDGRCGACRIEGGEGLSPMDEAERAAAAENRLGRPLIDGERLGCHARVIGPAKATLPVAWTLEDLPELPT